jgi:hypothetical protein
MGPGGWMRNEVFNAKSELIFAPEAFSCCEEQRSGGGSTK